jgi:Zinc finger, C2H2 type
VRFLSTRLGFHVAGRGPDDGLRLGWDGYASEDRLSAEEEAAMDEQGTQGGMVCSHCGQSFATQEELDRHMQEAHPDEGTGGTGGEDIGSGGTEGTPTP